MSKDDDLDQAGRNWLSTLHEARTNCRERVANAMVAVPDPHQMHWPVCSRQQMKGAHQAAMEAHVSVIDFADQVSPYAEEDAIEDIWAEKLSTVSAKPAGEDGELEVSLADLDKWEFAFVERSLVTEDELYGRTNQTQTKRILLPIVAMRECYRQLNQVVKALGFAAEADAESLPQGSLKTPEPRS